MILHPIIDHNPGLVIMQLNVLICPILPSASPELKFPSFDHWLRESQSEGEASTVSMTPMLLRTKVTLTKRQRTRFKADATKKGTAAEPNPFAQRNCQG